MHSFQERDNVGTNGEAHFEMGDAPKAMQNPFTRANRFKELRSQ